MMLLQYKGRISEDTDLSVLFNIHQSISFTDQPQNFIAEDSTKANTFNPGAI